MGGGGKGGSNEAEQARRDEQERQAKIREGTARIGQIFGSQFTPDYFDQQRQNYLNYATPQLEQQYGDAQKQLSYALDRAGNLDSSSRADLAAKLQKQYGVQKQGIADQALSYRTNAMNSVEDARGNLIGTLNATGDAEGAANDAIRRAQALSQPAAYSPLSALFADFTASLGQEAAAERAYELSGGAYGHYGAGLFGPRRGSVVNS